MDDGDPPTLKTRMRILHFNKTYYPDSAGGTEQVIYQLCRATCSHGIESEVLALSREPRTLPLTLDGHTVHCARLDFQVASTGFSLSALRRFRSLAAKADIVHYHFPWPFADLVHFATCVKKPTVLTYHSDIIRQKNLLRVYRPLMYRFLTSVDRIVATSPNYLATSHVLDRYKGKVKVIPIGLDRDSYPEPSAARLAEWLQRVGDRFFLFVGVLRYYKGLHILLDALQGTGYPVVIVGAGPIEAELKEHAQRMGLRNVMFLGFLPEEDKVALLRLCYAVVFPSHLRSEAFGVSLLEGAMHGKPMISSEIGTGTSYVNIDGETGLVVSPNNAEAFRGAMRYLWENPEVARAMGKRAEARYWKLFTADKMVAGYVALYRELLSERT